MFALTHFGMLSLGGFLFQNILTFNILQKNIIRRPHSPKAIRNRRDAYPESTEPQKVRQHVTVEKKLTRVGAPTNLKELSINKL